jgi:DNA repair photolyase
MPDDLPPQAIKGRGASSSASGRFERHAYSAVDDGWSADDDLPPLRTVVAEDASRTVISYNESPDLPFDRSINPYRGCEHGCIYCFARPSHAYLGLSPGLDFETRLFAKSDAADVLRRELAKPQYRCRPILLGANTDPYQPVERERQITRRVLEVLAECRHPVTILTKSDLVVRDLDLLAPMAADNLAGVGLSVTTLKPQLARTLEPRAKSPAKRLAAVRALNDAGVPTGVMAAPMIPALNDEELEAILKAAAESGARWAGYVLLRLPHEIKDLFAEWLDEHAPDRAKRVLGHIRDARGGKLYDSRFGERLRGQGPYADMLANRFQLACRRYGLSQGRGSGPSLDTTLFRPPPADGGRQMSLF